jgi:hypothetical protein
VAEKIAPKRYGDVSILRKRGTVEMQGIGPPTGKSPAPRSVRMVAAINRSLLVVELASLHSERLAKPARDVRSEPMAPGKRTEVRTGGTIHRG